MCVDDTNIYQWPNGKPKWLAIDLETRSEVDLSGCGVYRYVEGEKHTILLFCYQFEGDPDVSMVDMACGEELPVNVLSALNDPEIIKTAWNAEFERTVIGHYLGRTLSPDDWQCTMVWAAGLSLPLKLEKAAEVLKVEQQKDRAGEALIKQFSVPQKPSKKNGFKEWIEPEDAQEEWKQFKEYCKQDVRTEVSIRERLKNYPLLPHEWDYYHTPSDVAPILWQYGALSRLDKGEVIDPMLYDNYSTISLGYAGLCECTWRMKGCSHTDPKGKEFALAVMKFLNDKCLTWRGLTNISFSLYGTPMESTTYKFAQCLQRRFGIIPHVTDKSYITNSYHVHVTEPIDAFSKLAFEAEFQALSPGGAISYVEVPNMQNNIPAVLAVMKFIYDHIMYAELNTKSDYCQVCGYDGEIRIVDDDGKLVWECPNCGNRDQRKMNVCRRVCGYLGTQFFNQGRTAEIKDRFIHLSTEAEQ